MAHIPSSTINDFDTSRSLISEYDGLVGRNHNQNFELESRSFANIWDQILDSQVLPAERNGLELEDNQGLYTSNMPEENNSVTIQAEQNMEDWAQFEWDRPITGAAVLGDSFQREIPSLNDEPLVCFGMVCFSPHAVNGYNNYVRFIELLLESVETCN
jgi:hypothetical protein